MKYVTPDLESERLILKKGIFDDYRKVYEFDFTKLRDINGEFKFVKLEDKDILGFDTYSSEYDCVYDWIIYLKNGMPIGNIVADREDDNLHSIELSFNLHPNYWGCGYMKEACIIVMDYLFERGYSYVICGYSEGNIKSQKLNNKIGFEVYKVEKDSWEKDGQLITDYKTIISKDRFYELYKCQSKVKG